MDIFWYRKLLCLMHAMSGLRIALGVKVREDKFYAGELCDVEDRLANNCSVHMAGVKTFSQCLFQCGLEPTCVGASKVGRKNGCFHHYACDRISRCSKKSIDHIYKSKNCAHGGVWNPLTSSCSCANSWVGAQCLDLPSRCNDLRRHGYTSRRTYLALRPSPSSSPSADSPRTLAQCFCMLYAGSSWSAIGILNNFGGINFNRTWDDYKNGFYFDSKNFWIGLENWHLFSLAGYTTLVTALSFGDHYREYRGFRVADESRGYSFDFLSSSMHTRKKPDPISFDDCLRPLVNKSFLTKDSYDDDNGSSGGIFTPDSSRYKNKSRTSRGHNCAWRVGYGWWHDVADADLCTSVTSSSGTDNCSFLGKSPADWDETVPEYQKMRVSGVDPSLFKYYHINAGVTMYLEC